MYVYNVRLELLAGSFFLRIDNSFSVITFYGSTWFRTVGDLELFKPIYFSFLLECVSVLITSSVSKLEPWIANRTQGRLEFYWLMPNVDIFFWCFSNLKSLFLGERKEICIANSPVSSIGFLRKPVQCKESRIGKRPIEVPPNVTIALDGQDLKVKGPLGELSRTYPREVKLQRLESGTLRVFKALDTRRANQMHGLFR